SNLVRAEAALEQIGPRAALVRELCGKKSAEVCRYRKAVARLGVKNVDHVLGKVVEGAEGEFAVGEETSGHTYSALRIYAGGPRHPNEVVCVAFLDLGNIAAHVLKPGSAVSAKGTLQGVTFERVRCHATIILVDEGSVVLIAIEVKKMIVKEFYLPVDLAYYAVTMWARLEQQGAVAVYRAEETVGGVKGSGHAEAIEKPAGLVRERAAQGPGFVDAVIEPSSIEIVATAVEIELRVAEESRRIFQLLLQRGKHWRWENVLFKGYLDGSNVVVHRRRKRLLKQDHLLRR